MKEYYYEILFQRADNEWTCPLKRVFCFEKFIPNYDETLKNLKNRDRTSKSFYKILARDQKNKNNPDRSYFQVCQMPVETNKSH